MKLDLNDLESVKKFSVEVSKKYPVVDILLNNAGIMALQTRETTC
jgi:short-subunit dehydrogenase involved in D-alanine esterification of teichoic acids